VNPLQLDFRVVGFLEHENRDKAGLTLSHLPNRLQAPWPRLAALTGLWHIPVHVLCKYLIYLDKSEDSESRSPSQTFNSPSSSRHSHAPRGVCRAPQPHAPAGGGATEPPPSAPHRQAPPGSGRPAGEAMRPSGMGATALSAVYGPDPLDLCGSRASQDIAGRLLPIHKILSL